MPRAQEPGNFCHYSSSTSRHLPDLVLVMDDGKDGPLELSKMSMLLDVQICETQVSCDDEATCIREQVG